ncbi:MAG TPA: alpha/beta hydrolase [Pirellulaceae bacterium]|nr:alpha/beta hydrolase [Pirellulaceae bacterium]
MTTKTFAGLLIPLLLLAGAARGQDDYAITDDVVYGHKDGMALTFDVIQPKSPNGAGVLFLQSGGWYSTWRPSKDLVPASMPLLSKGFTVFIVRHGSAPKYTVPEAVADVRKCVRFIRLNADDYGVDPQRLGALGGSAGGHLTLMLATTGDDGDESATDPVLKTSSRIAAGVSLFPPTDLRGWTTDPPEEIAKVPALKPPLTFDPKQEGDVSPILHVTEDDAPVLMIHGDKDLLVPIEHSQNILPVFEKAGVKSKLVTIEGAAHGFSGEQNVKTVLPAMVGWFEEKLAETK